MSTFLKDDFLLTTSTAKKLYNNYAKDMPIIDYHCHVSPKEIYENAKFENITKLWLGGDHYKWRLMRSNGVNEYYITGEADDFEKFLAFSKMLPKAIGNPMYHWCHLELKNYFGYNGVLNEYTAQQVWDICNKKLTQDGMRVRDIITKSNVAFIGTTDDPVDSLEYHKLLQQDKSFKTTVAPSFRPDKAVNIDKPIWRDYIKTLADTVGFEICDITSLEKALALRIQYFNAHGCKLSDHGLDYMVYEELDKTALNEVMKKALSGQEITKTQADAFKTELVVFCAKQYHKLGWVMQLHYNCLRNPNTLMFNTLGADVGFDVIGPNDGSGKLSKLLDKLYREFTLPRTIIYSLDPSDNQVIDTIIGAFQGDEVAGKIQHGSAWWFNDNKQGMRDQLISLANLSLLGNFVGMLTDSRSFLSYTRHEYFRRILCGLIGEWVENGEYPNDEKSLKEIVCGICYQNAHRYFGLN
jgi:glucuronate isomerase